MRLRGGRSGHIFILQWRQWIDAFRFCTHGFPKSANGVGDAGTLRFAGVNSTMNNIVLVSNGTSFAI